MLSSNRKLLNVRTREKNLFPKRRCIWNVAENWIFRVWRLHLISFKNVFSRPRFIDFLIIFFVERNPSFVIRYSPPYLFIRINSQHRLKDRYDKQGELTCHVVNHEIPIYIQNLWRVLISRSSFWCNVYTLTPGVILSRLTSLTKWHYTKSTHSWCLLFLFYFPVFISAIRRFKIFRK